MLFNVEFDAGVSVSGYIVPDGFAEAPRILVRSGGEEILSRPADQPRDALVVAGRHDTGLCGFMLDETILPGLAEIRDLEIIDAGSGLLIYRRRLDKHIAKRILRLESHLFPLWRLDVALRERFQYSATQIENHGRETTTQMFHLNSFDSVFLSGRIMYRTFQHLIDDRFDVIYSMHHPYEELAERLIVLGQIHKMGSGILGLRENMSLEAAMSYAQALPLQDEKALGRALRKIPNAVAQVLANPVMRQLTTTQPDEMPSPGAMSAALGTLSSFAVVGLRRAPATFEGAVAELSGVDVSNSGAMAKLPGVTSLAKLLRRTQEVEWLIELDLHLYDHIARAYRATANDIASA